MKSRRIARLPRDVTPDNWGGIFTDLALWRPVVEHIFRERRIGPARLVESTFPGTCAVFLVDDQVVLKLFPQFLLQDFYKEREVYQHLSGQIRELPRLLAEGIFHDQIDWPYLILEYRRGDPIRELRSSIGSDQARNIARDLGRLIRRVHQTPIAAFTYFDSRPEAWYQFLSQRLGECLAELRRSTSLSDNLLADAAKFLDSIELVPDAFEPVLINADLTEDHLLLVQRNGTWQISALIDWADAEAGAPEYEWVALWLGLCNRDPDLFRHILSAYDPVLQLDEKFRRRAMAYTFLHRFGAEIIADVLASEGDPPVDSLVELQNLLWPPF